MVHKAWHAWPVFLVRHYARQAWNDLPGPWYAKVALIAVLQFIPGQLDEILLLALLRYFRVRRALAAKP